MYFDNPERSAYRMLYLIGNSKRVAATSKQSASNKMSRTIRDVARRLHMSNAFNCISLLLYMSVTHQPISGDRCIDERM